MRIHSFSRVLVLPILILVGIVYYLYSYVDRDYSVYIMVPVACAVAVYIFHGQIDYWYLKKYPYGLDEALKSWLKRYFRPYTELDYQQKAAFEQRLEWYLNARLIQAMGSEIKEVPEDIKASVAGFAVWMTLHMEDYLIGDFDRIFLYKHHFPSPSKTELHAVEVNAEDGVILLNSQHLAMAIIEPDAYYNVAVHAFSEAIQHVKGRIPALRNDTGLEQVSGWAISDIEKQTGLSGIDPMHVHVHHYFIFSNKYRQIFPDNARILDDYFRDKVG